jgi:hypothetical protein
MLQRACRDREDIQLAVTGRGCHAVATGQRHNAPHPLILAVPHQLNNARRRLGGLHVAGRDHTTAHYSGGSGSATARFCSRRSSSDIGRALSPENDGGCRGRVDERRVSGNAALGEAAV